MALLYRTVSLQTDYIHLDLLRGFSEPAEVRGSDIVIPGRPGLVVTDHVKQQRRILLEGWVWGGPHGTEAQRQVLWRTATDALMALLDRTLAPGELELQPPYLGLSDPQTIDARCLNAVGGPIEACMTYQRWNIELLAVGNPPEWVAGS